MSFIVRFDSEQARTAFLNTLRKHAPGLVKRIHVSQSNSQIVTCSVDSPAEDKVMRELIGPNAKAFDDVQMRTFEGW